MSPKSLWLRFWVIRLFTQEGNLTFQSDTSFSRNTGVCCGVGWLETLSAICVV